MKEWRRRKTWHTDTLVIVVDGYEVLEVELTLLRPRDGSRSAEAWLDYLFEIHRYHPDMVSSFLDLSHQLVAQGEITDVRSSVRLSGAELRKIRSARVRRT
jgi:hypothetical protein